MNTNERNEEGTNEAPFLGSKGKSFLLLIGGIVILTINHLDALNKGTISFKLILFGVLGILFGIGGFRFPHMYNIIGPDGKERTTKTAFALLALGILLGWFVYSVAYPAGWLTP